MADSKSCDTLLLLWFARLYTPIVCYVFAHIVHLCEFDFIVLCLQFDLICIRLEFTLCTLEFSITRLTTLT